MLIIPDNLIIHWWNACIIIRNIRDGTTVLKSEFIRVAKIIVLLIGRFSRTVAKKEKYIVIYIYNLFRTRSFPNYLNVSSQKSALHIRSGQANI